MIFEKNFGKVLQIQKIFIPLQPLNRNGALVQPG